MVRPIPLAVLRVLLNIFVPKTARASARIAPPGEALTLEVLRDLAKHRREDELEKIFESGAPLREIPIGFAPGTRWFLLKSSALGRVLNVLLGGAWVGKTVMAGEDPAEATGLNRTACGLLLGAFRVAMSSDRRELIFSFERPRTRGYFHETLLELIPIFDRVVGVPGKNGLIYVGKSWIGHYDPSGNFEHANPSRPIAWFFLDFDRIEGGKA